MKPRHLFWLSLSAGLVVGLWQAFGQDTSDIPDPKLTPGAVASTDPAEVCRPGYAREHRNVPLQVWQQAYARYGIWHHEPGQYELDHLIPLELGGSNDLANLWPEPYAGTWGARRKDRLENQLHDAVCASSLRLDIAQKAIAHDWINLWRVLNH